MVWYIFGFTFLLLLVFILVTVVIDERRSRLKRSQSGKMTVYWDGAERRGSVRINTILNTKYLIDSQKKNSISKNISLGGILMESTEKLLPTTRLILDIYLPDEEKPITTKGEVIWNRELQHTDNEGRKLFDMGIKFLSMSPADRKRLNKHIKGFCNTR